MSILENVIANCLNVGGRDLLDIVSMAEAVEAGSRGANNLEDAGVAEKEMDGRLQGAKNRVRSEATSRMLLVIVL